MVSQIDIKKFMHAYFTEHWDPVREDLYAEWSGRNRESLVSEPPEAAYLTERIPEEDMLAEFKDQVDYNPNFFPQEKIIAASFPVPLDIQSRARRAGIWVVDIYSVMACAVEKNLIQIKSLGKNGYAYAQCCRDLKYMDMNAAWIEDAIISDDERKLWDLLQTNFKAFKRYLELRLIFFMRAGRDFDEKKSDLPARNAEVLFLREQIREIMSDVEFMELINENSMNADREARDFYYRCRSQCLPLLFSLWDTEPLPENMEIVKKSFAALRHYAYEIARVKSYYFYFFRSFGAYIRKSLISEVAKTNRFTRNSLSVNMLGAMISGNPDFTEAERQQFNAYAQLGLIEREATEVVKRKITTLYYGLYEIQQGKRDNDFIFTGYHTKRNADADGSPIKKWILTLEDENVNIWKYTLRDEEESEKWSLEILIHIRDAKQPADERTCDVYCRESGKEEMFTRLPYNKEEIIGYLQKALNVNGYEGAKIVGIWYESQYENRIPERSLVFDPNIRIRREGDTVYFKDIRADGEKNGSHDIHADGAKADSHDRQQSAQSLTVSEQSLTVPEQARSVSEQTDPVPQQDPASGIFYHDLAPEKRKINGITALVGKNGTGKSTVFRMIGLDAAPEEYKADFSQYYIFYKIYNQYYYSTNKENGFRLDGIDDIFNVSNTQIKDSNIVYYSGALSANRKTNLDGFSGTDISNGYILLNEAGQKGSERFWDTARKLQLLKDLKLKGKRGNIDFEKLFHFLPSYCHVQIPESWYEKRRIAGKTDWKPVKTDILHGNEPWSDFLIPLNDRTSRGCLDLYELISKELANGGMSAEDFTYEITGLSSGQYALFDLYARLHSFFCSQLKSDAKYNCFRADNGLHNYILLLDEVELYLHPEWQKGFIEQMIDFLEWEQSYRTNYQVLPFENLQIFMASNSPFFMSDLPKANICRLPEGGNPVDESEDTFAQNIHTIMKNSFFMGNGLIGDFASRKIDEIIRELLGKDQTNEISEGRKAEIRYLISQIGEPLIREPLEKIYQERFPVPEPAEKRAYTLDELQEKLDPETYRSIAEQLEK